MTKLGEQSTPLQLFLVPDGTLQKMVVTENTKQRG